MQFNLLTKTYERFPVEVMLTQVEANVYDETFHYL
jgi:hypothetical protein